MDQFTKEDVLRSLYNQINVLKVQASLRAKHPSTPLEHMIHFSTQEMTFQLVLDLIQERIRES